MAEELVAVGNAQNRQLIPTPGFGSLLEKIRPEWQARDLIGRVRALLPVDASSACQRLLNAAIHDLKQKILIAGLDLAQEAATVNHLPPIKRNEDILEGYSTFHTLELAYRMGLLDRPEFKRLQRAYEIRRDLEHEDNEYVAELEDIVYIFRSAIEIVLSREPIQLPRVDDVKELIEAPSHATPSQEFIAEYGRAPHVRQLEITRYLVRIALDSNAADITRQNAVQALRTFSAPTQNTVKLELAKEVSERTKRHALTLVQAKVAQAGGFFPYLKQRQTAGLFHELNDKLDQIGTHWTKYQQHGAPLDDIEELGGLIACPDDARKRMLHWMVLCYIGEPGGYGRGWNRRVFYSNSASHRILRMVRAAGPAVRDMLEQLRNDPLVNAAMKNADVAARFEELLGVANPA